MSASVVTFCHVADRCCCPLEVSSPLARGLAKVLRLAALGSGSRATDSASILLFKSSILRFVDCNFISFL